MSTVPPRTTVGHHETVRPRGTESAGGPAGCGRSRPRRGRRTTAALVVGLAMIAAGCGLPQDEEARAITDLPEELYSIPDSETSGEGDPNSRFEVGLFFFNDEDSTLVRIDRARDDPPTLQSALDELARPPSAEELSDLPNLVTKLPANLAPQITDLADGVAQVSVSDEGGLRTFEAENPERVQQVFRQVVCTLVTLDRQVEGVQIADSSGPIRVSGVEGVPIERAVTPADLPPCEPAPSSTSTLNGTSTSSPRRTTAGTSPRPGGVEP
ncbi:MAG: GerMN domain-containing protein [Acidimicrobiales bacterium]